MPDTLRLAGALLPPHTHDDLLVAIQESGAPVMAAASVLDFGPGLDVTEGPAGEADIALDLTESIWTFAQGGFRFRDGAGPLLSTGASGDDLSLIGDLAVSGRVAVGDVAVIEMRKGLNVQFTTGDCTLYERGAGAYIRPRVNSTTQCYAYGISGEVEWIGSGNASYLMGLNFNPIQNGSGNLIQMHGAQVILSTRAGAGTVDQCYGVTVVPDFLGNRPTMFSAFHIQAFPGLNTVYGIHVEDFTGTTIRLLEMGPQTPYLRLLGGGDPGAGQTNLYLKEQWTLRRVQWKDASALVAGDRVMVLV
jgi:hypothetical protein